ncbi:uracil-DNA glycosylase [Natrarchaeobaculum sulfurireducens]|uniref:Uracil DNA glycosylase superfamily protein n=1 Tax=Natrarchaeobaculum sulfurireducens TaxID=2044521 RepID=A0A346PFM2_9EURY|nr:uracil-DNA glycosylase family protein [Natrarchaeobaculum sulfurireducens]AXR78317.1 Uracil-DNA glycosylase [Natrarchaeobaculum sulfurireducens]AXR81652.1 Uracil DNA glycosylase superfamily protein [Natrarchaeobaculum sulfurireducens]
MDEECQNCPALCETRTQVVHGYGDVAADFLFVGERPSSAADAAGVPFATDGTVEPESGTTLRRLLERLGLCDATSPSERPGLENAYLTLLTRCRHPERSPADEEVANCDPYLEAEIRMINPEILVPVGERALVELAEEYTRTPASELRLPERHATTIRGRGFAIVPMIDPQRQSETQTQSWVEHFAQLLATDYRQTKGRRER